MTVHIDLSRDYDLEAAHIARISRIFQAILIAFQKEFEEKSKIKKREIQLKYNSY